MRKIREVLRLAAGGLAQHQIAKACSIVESTVHNYLKLAKAANVSWTLPDDLSDQKLDALLFGKRADPLSGRIHPAPDFAAVHNQLQTHKNLTLQLLWDEYQKEQPDGYGYNRFCDLYGECAGARNITLRQQHRLGKGVCRLCRCHDRYP